MPHGEASGKVIEYGDFVTIDFGCVFEGYCSDMTRTLIMGEASARQKEIYDIVLLAQTKSIEAIKPGVLCKDIDKIARDIVHHLPRRGFRGKAMVVSVDKYTAVKMYDKVQHYWGEEKKKLTVEQLLELFSKASGSDEANDKLLLS